ncbi:DUF3316 domain-containing protein [Xylanibacter caecicola]|uniref:DUF3316 domain-containing protein n=1 Tax=Xylanibacter caecicola TaxID=2736294 RepID=UPI0025888ECF|nr:DUF3316 domain-containing protein [Xylanibacter caecicola]
MKIFRTALCMALLAVSVAAGGQTDSTEYMRGYTAGRAAAMLEGKQESPSPQKVITNARMLGVGGVNILDTYISPEKYRGTELRYISHTTRMREWGTRVSRQIVHQGYVSHTENRSGDGDEIAGMYCFSYGAHYNMALCGGSLTVKVGGTLDADIGFLYNTRNSNNPAQARLSLAVSPSAIAEWRFRAWKRPFTLRYEVGAPLVGVMFSPNYGQSYYEIFSRGDYDHNVVPTTIASTPSLRQMLTLGFTLHRTTLRVGWIGDWQQAEVNNLKYHSYSNMFVVGIVRSFKTTRVSP